jgi:hypothetical protein
MGASTFPVSEEALTPLAGLGKAIWGYLIQAILVDIDPDSVLDERCTVDKCPAGYYEDMYADVAWAVANPVSGEALPVSAVLRFKGTI